MIYYYYYYYSVHIRLFGIKGGDDDKKLSRGFDFVLLFHSGPHQDRASASSFSSSSSASLVLRA